MVHRDVAAAIILLNLIVLVVVLFGLGCGSAIPDADAYSKCMDHFSELDRTNIRCVGRPVAVDAASHCENAYSVDEDAFEGCIAYLHDVACADFNDTTYRAACFPAFAMKTW